MSHFFLCFFFCYNVLKSCLPHRRQKAFVYGQVLNASYLNWLKQWRRNRCMSLENIDQLSAAVLAQILISEKKSF